jgi:hypothetical protein
MDKDADVHAKMVEVGVWMGASIVSGAGTSSIETLLSPLSLDEVRGTKSCGGEGSEMDQTASGKIWAVYGAQTVSH